MSPGRSGTGSGACVLLTALLLGMGACVPPRESKPGGSAQTGTEPAISVSDLTGTVRRVELPLDDAVAFQFAVIGPGRFVMGAPPDEPGHDSHESQREVDLPKAFGMAVHELTVTQYWRVVDTGHAVADADRTKPVANVSWDEAMDFCRKLSNVLPGRRFRLPTEVEWEYACRAGQSQMFSVWVGGPDWSDLEQAVVAHRGGDPNRLARRAVRVIRFDSGEPAAVGSLSPNPWGLYDMHGNVWEWCDLGPGDDDAPSLNHRPMRGGAWVSTTCLDCRAAKRAWQRRGERTAAIGFRIVLENP